MIAKRELCLQAQVRKFFEGHKMKIVIAPDSFKHSLSAMQVAQAIAQGVLDVCPDAQLDLCPIADGGEGTVDAMVSATGGKILHADVLDPLGANVRAKFGMLGKHTAADMLPGAVGLLGAQAMTYTSETSDELSDCAVIEMCQASGIMLVKKARRDPLRTTTFGTGQLILEAIDAGAREIIIGLGGSATVDAGAGALQALGVKFYDSEDQLIGPVMTGGHLQQIARIDPSGLTPELAVVKLRVAYDVTNPLTGAEGAARVFATQKGATPQAVETLESGLVNFAQLAEKVTGRAVDQTPGAGAAGGLGAGLCALANATMEPGAKLIASATGLSQRLHNADLCITGEGKIDSQTRFGKVPVRVSQIAAKLGVSTICVAGQQGENPPGEFFREIITLVDDQIDSASAVANAADLIRQKVRKTMQNYPKPG